jgi:hypothetical protein
MIQCNVEEMILFWRGGVRKRDLQKGEALMEWMR